MENLLNELTKTGFSVEMFLTAGVFFAAASLLVGWLGKVIFGNNNELGHAVSSAIGILFIYIITVLVLMAGPELEKFKEFLSPLPFVNIEGEQLQLFVYAESTFDAICVQVLSMVILAFLVNLLDTLLPRGDTIMGWFLFRCVTVILGMAAHWLVCQLLTAFLPDVIVNYASVILLGVLVVMLSVGIFRFLVGAAIATVNPIVGALYTFFFANIIGVQLSKSVLTTALLSLLIYALNELGIITISIAAAALMAFVCYRMAFYNPKAKNVDPEQIDIPEGDFDTFNGLVFSQLDEIPGVGEKRKQDLLKAFKSISALSEATLQDLERHVPKNVAYEIYKHFHSEEK